MRRVILTIVCFILLFTFTPAQAALVFFDTANPIVELGETISISIFSTVETDSIRMDRISDADFGIASNLYLNPNYPLGSGYNEGVAVNNIGVLIEGIKAGIGLPTWSGVSGVLYSFDYLVPISSFGHTITIFADPSNGSVNEVTYWDGSSLAHVTPDSLTLTVVPEPGSIVLLGLGMLLARKIKAKNLE